MIAILLLGIIGFGQGLYVDVGHDLYSDSGFWPTSRPFANETSFKNFTGDGIWVEYYRLKFNEHTSTHMDAPNHFYEHGISVDKIPIEDLIGPAIVLDITEKVRNNSQALLTVSDIKKFEQAHGMLPNNAIVFIRTGWSSRYGKSIDYYGVEVQSDTDAAGLVGLNFPGISGEAAKMLANYQNVTGMRILGVAIEGPSLDNGLNSQFFPAHVHIARANIWGVENIAGSIAKVPATGMEAVVMPIKTRGGTGGPCRIFVRT